MNKLEIRPSLRIALPAALHYLRQDRIGVHRNFEPLSTQNIERDLSVRGLRPGFFLRLEREIRGKMRGEGREGGLVLDVSSSSLSQLAPGQSMFVGILSLFLERILQGHLSVSHGSGLRLEREGEREGGREVKGWVRVGEGRVRK